MSEKVKLCIIQYNKPYQQVSETFLRAHEERLPADVTVIYGSINPKINGKFISPRTCFSRFSFRVISLVFGRVMALESDDPYVRAFKKNRPDVVLAEYGTMGVNVLKACRAMGIPLVVHFHGHDISKTSILLRYSTLYKSLFQYASAVVAVSKKMKMKLIDMGAPEGKLYWNPCGVDCNEFKNASPGNANKIFLSVGRFVKKKGPHLSIRAFSQVLRTVPDAQLRMVGDGELLPFCKKLVCELHIDRQVTFLGEQSHDIVKKEMRNARCFIQHSVQAADGDSEGTPVGVMEAGASGLPVVASRHEGIEDVVMDGNTGLLFEEGDVDEMAKCMVRIIQSPQMADTFGRNARYHVQSNFSMEKSIGILWQIIQRTIRQ